MINKFWTKWSPFGLVPPNNLNKNFRMKYTDYPSEDSEKNKKIKQIG